jgi:TctA family transporter
MSSVFWMVFLISCSAFALCHPCLWLIAAVFWVIDFGPALIGIYTYDCIIYNVSLMFKFDLLGYLMIQWDLSIPPGFPENKE